MVQPPGTVKPRGLDEGALRSGDMEEDGVVVVVFRLHRSAGARRVLDLARVAVQHRAAAVLQLRPQLVEGERQRVLRRRRPRQRGQVGEALGDAQGEGVEAGAAVGVARQDADALAELLEASGASVFPLSSAIALPSVQSAARQAARVGTPEAGRVRSVPWSGSTGPCQLRASLNAHSGVLPFPAGRRPARH